MLTGQLDITEKTGADVDEELVQLMEGLLKDKLQEVTIEKSILARVAMDTRVVAGFNHTQGQGMIFCPKAESQDQNSERRGTRSRIN